MHCRLVADVDDKDDSPVGGIVAEHDNDVVVVACMALVSGSCKAAVVGGRLCSCYGRIEAHAGMDGRDDVMEGHRSH